MSFKIDQRGSKDQRILYQYLSDIYPSLEIVYEYPLHELGQRIDIYIPGLALALEYNGIQHYKYVEFFHKNIENYKYNLELDKKKREYLQLHGIKLIEIPYDNMVKDKEELFKIINNTPYPDFPYKPLPESSEKQDSFKEIIKEKRKEEYQVRKNTYQEDPQIRKDRLEKEKQFRQERYKKMKENK